MISEAISEAQKQGWLSLFVFGQVDQNIVATFNQDAEGTWLVTVIPASLTVPLDSINEPPPPPPYPLRFDGAAGSYRIAPEGSITDLPGEPDLSGGWQGIDISDSAELWVTMRGTPEDGPINSAAMKIATEHDVSHMLPQLDRDWEGGFAVYGDAYVQEFCDDEDEAEDAGMVLRTETTDKGFSASIALR